MIEFHYVDPEIILWIQNSGMQILIKILILNPNLDPHPEYRYSQMMILDHIPDLHSRVEQLSLLISIFCNYVQGCVYYHLVVNPGVVSNKHFHLRKAKKSAIFSSYFNQIWVQNSYQLVLHFST